MEGKGVPFVGRMFSWRKQGSRIDVIFSTAESLYTGRARDWYCYCCTEEILKERLHPWAAGLLSDLHRRAGRLGAASLEFPADVCSHVGAFQAARLVIIKE